MKQMNKAMAGVVTGMFLLLGGGVVGTLAAEPQAGSAGSYLAAPEGDETAPDNIIW